LNTISIDSKESKKYIEELRELLHKLIEIKGISSDEFIKVSRDLDKLIVKYYQENQIIIKKDKVMRYTRKINIIIADNCKDFCTILSDYLLNERDIAVIGIANNEIELFKLVQEKKPDLVVLDLISHFDGLGILKRLNTLNIYPMPRIIILSAVSESGTAKKALALGVEHYFVKPFELDEFIKQIKNMFDNTLNNALDKH